MTNNNIDARAYAEPCGCGAPAGELFPDVTIRGTLCCLTPGQHAVCSIDGCRLEDVAEANLRAFNDLRQAALATPEASHSEEALREMLAQEYERADWKEIASVVRSKHILSWPDAPRIALAAMRRLTLTTPTIAPSARTNETEE